MTTIKDKNGWSKGPWEVVDRHGEPRYVVQPDGKGGHWGVCQPDCTSDCALISAAPELYEALAELVWMCDRKTDAFDRARAALAKARGE